MATEIPPERILDLFTRIDDLLVLNLEATRKLTEAVEGLTKVLAVAPPTVPPVAPPPRVVVAPAPAELMPLTTRLDSIGLKLDAVDASLAALKSSLEEYRRCDLQGKPVAVVDTYSGSATTYKTVALWRVGDMWGLGKGVIWQVSMVTNEYDKTDFRLTVAGKVLFKDLRIARPLSLAFPPHELPRGEKVIVECRSTDGTKIRVDGSITGKEF